MIRPDIGQSIGTGFFLERITKHLPQCRPMISDISGAEHSLLTAAANESTKYLLRCNRRPMNAVSTGAQAITIPADLRLLYPSLVGRNWLADLIVLSSSEASHWQTASLALLTGSSVPAVAQAFRRSDPRLPPGRIDATVAMLCIALDRLTYRGEGLLIANNATIERLILDCRAPYHGLAAHIWGLLRRPTPTDSHEPTLVTNSDPDDDESPPNRTAFDAAVIYFARDHYSGLRDREGVNRVYRSGAQIGADWMALENTVKVWRGMERDWRFCAATAAQCDLLLKTDGTIHVSALAVAHESRTLNRFEVKGLFNLHGKRLGQLLLDRAKRKDLLNQLTIWRVEPALRNAVNQALQEFYVERAPIHPLSASQRLGYLAEQEFITCVRDWSDNQAMLFLARRSYALRTDTIQVTRVIERRNIEGELEAVEWSGEELAIYITNEHGREVCFTPNSHHASSELRKRFVVLDMPSLIEHFHIPDVPDIATVRQAAFAQNLQALTRLETMIAA